MRRIMKCGTSLDVTDYLCVVKYRNVTDISIPLKILKLNGEKFLFDDIYAIRITDYK